jgi:hypothetical protein
MPSRDPLRVLAHDHADLNRRVLALAARIETIRANGDRTTPRELIGLLDDLRDPLFFHFAREEEGLFPFLAEVAPDVEAHVHAMASAHDVICGAVGRMYQLATADASISTLSALFARFEASYAAHARDEAALLDALERRLGDDHRRRLAALVAGL